jgi:RIO kinase 1
LIHGDLSEYNIMVVPANLVENKDSSIEDEQIEVQAVLIDFGQAVVKQHPEALNLLRRDLEMVRSFFLRQGIQVMDEDQALAFVLQPDRTEEESGGGSGGKVSEAPTG